MVASIDALPYELLNRIMSLLDKEDILKLRRVAPRTILPFVNSVLFENLVVDIDGTDDLPRWYEAEADGVATKRIHEVAASRIADHVRVLTLRLTRPYSLSGYYEKLGVKRYPIGYVPPPTKVTLAQRISSVFKPKAGTSGPHRPRENVDYAKELAAALCVLFKATDLVKSVRLVQPDGYNSEYDIVYPSVYARVLVRLFTALKSVQIPENSTLELMNCPITHLEEAGIQMDEKLASEVLTKFTKLHLQTRSMGYAVIKHGTTELRNTPYDGKKPSGVSGLGWQLLRGLCENPLRLEALKVECERKDRDIVAPFIQPKVDWSLLRSLALLTFEADPDHFSTFMAHVLPHLQLLALVSGRLLNSKHGQPTWRSLFDTWISIKNSIEPREWPLAGLTLIDLVDHDRQMSISTNELATVVESLLPKAPKQKLRRLA